MEDSLNKKAQVKSKAKPLRGNGLPALVLAACLPPFLIVSAFAGGTPLFEYAKTHWRSSRYLVSVVRKGRFTKNEMSALNLLRKAECDGIIDVDIVDSLSAHSIPALADARLAKHSYIVLRRQFVEGFPRCVLSAPLNEKSVAMILDSPARRDLAKRLLSGTSAVFILLDGSDPSENAAAERLMMARLKILERKLNKLRSAEASAKRSLSAKPLRFSVLRLRNLRMERCLKAIILSSDPELSKLAFPVVIPVFGRGRALPMFYGKGVNKFNISAAVETLTSEKVDFSKSQTPGFDILTTADWKRGFGAISQRKGVRLAGLLSMALAAKASERFEAEKRNSGVNDDNHGRAHPAHHSDTDSSTDNHILAVILVSTASLLILLFTAVAAHQLQDKQS